MVELAKDMAWKLRRVKNAKHAAAGAKMKALRGMEIDDRPLPKDSLEVLTERARLLTTPSPDCYYHLKGNFGLETEDPAWEALLQPGTKAVVANFPHNPTGALPSRDEFDAVVSLCRRHGASLFCDEMYRGRERDDGRPEAALQQRRRPGGEGQHGGSAEFRRERAGRHRRLKCS